MGNNCTNKYRFGFGFLKIDRFKLNTRNYSKKDGGIYCLQAVPTLLQEG